MDLSPLNLSPAQIDCATCVMLKILDEKCKMPLHEKIIMEQLYDRVRSHEGLKLGVDQHNLIAKARAMRDDVGLSEDMRDLVYEQRLYGETMISRPVMKDFKFILRKTGILPEKITQTDD
jgi:hypothetical protein